MTGPACWRLAHGKTLSLDPSVRLHQGATAQVTSLGMLGDKYIEILPGDPTAPLLPPGAELGGTNTPSFDDVMRVATEIGEDVKEVTEALRASIGGTQGDDRRHQTQFVLREGLPAETGEPGVVDGRVVAVFDLQRGDSNGAEDLGQVLGLDGEVIG